MQQNDKLRNVAIIAHVDHGKTTLVDALFRQSGVFRADQQVDDRVMDSMDLERERGITIAAKNCAVHWNGVKINIIDTPGHADFGGEVERSLSMASGAILLVDASEGPLPQTRFVLRKTLEAGLPVVVVINKIDRKDARPDEVLNEVYDLFIDLDASDEQLEFPVLYAIGRAGVAMRNIDDEQKDLTPLFETILEKIPGPSYDPEQPFQMLVADLDYSDYLGRLAVGRIMHGSIYANESLACIGEDGQARPLRASKIQVYEGLQLAEVDKAQPGDIVVVAGIEDVTIGDTICTRENPRALPRIRVDEPTVAMRFGINTSPLAGREGKLVQSRMIRDRLNRECLRNVAVRVEDTTDKDAFLVKGRGEFQMAILIETMRREGYELQVGQPQVIYKEIDGKKCEPIEELTINVPEEYSSKMIDMVTRRKGELTSMQTIGDRVDIEFDIPSRGIIGLRTNVLTASAGEAIMAHRFKEYQPYKGDIERRTNGSMIAMETGTAFAYAIDKLQDRGRFFIYPQEEVYAGQVVGEHVHENDLVINVTKSKKLTNMRASGSDDKARIIPPVIFSLEEALEYIKEDEYVEVTPKSMRMRKVILDETERKRANKV